MELMGPNGTKLIKRGVVIAIKITLDKGARLLPGQKWVRDGMGAEDILIF